MIETGSRRIAVVEVEQHRNRPSAGAGASRAAPGAQRSLLVGTRSRASLVVHPTHIPIHAAKKCNGSGNNSSAVADFAVRCPIRHFYAPRSRL
jgi:hypothetical protein